MLATPFYQNEIRQILSVINKASKENRSIIVIKKNYQYSLILQFLYNEGFLQSFEERKKFLLIRLKKNF
jgi:ribosomal protein S8